MSDLTNLEQRYQEAVEFHEKSGKRYSAAKRYFDSIENKDKVIQAKIAIAASGSMDVRKWTALASKEYEDYLALRDDANGKFLDAKVEYDNAIVRVDEIRSIMSNQREQIARFRG